MSTAERAWEHAQTWAADHDIPDPAAFADGYAQMVEDLLYEPRYPDAVIPGPADFFWP